MTHHCYKVQKERLWQLWQYRALRIVICAVKTEKLFYSVWLLDKC